MMSLINPRFIQVRRPGSARECDNLAVLFVEAVNEKMRHRRRRRRRSRADPEYEV